jgi:hypothetical protein
MPLRLSNAEGPGINPRFSFNNVAILFNPFRVDEIVLLAFPG